MNFSPCTDTIQMGDKIVIVGAGVVGLYTALLLARQDKARHITVIAEYLPGDQSSKFTSPWAGANFSTISGDDEAALEYDRISFKLLDKIVEEFQDDQVIKKLPTTELWSEVPSESKLQSLKQYIPDLHILSENELRIGAVAGISFTTYNFNAPKYITALKAYLSKVGVTFVRRKIDNIKEAYLSSNTKVVFNCTGNGAATLGGVSDSKCYPIRGQICIVRAPHIQENFSYWSGSELCYIIPRPYSGGHVIIGGFYQEGNDSPDTYGFETQTVLDRARRFFPKIFKYGEPEIIREASGLRPGRKGGARIEKEVFADGKILIHNYGAGGTGYQSGLGMATKAVALLPEESKL